MRKPYERSERSQLIRAVKKQGEAVPTAAARFGVSVATAYRWMKDASVAPSTAVPTFVEVMPETAERAKLTVRVGAAEIEVEAGFDAQLLRQVVVALGGQA